MDKKQIWLCDLTHTYQTIAANRMPLGVGMIAAYGQKILGDRVSFTLYKFLDDLFENLREDSPPMIIGFSNFVWNKNLNLEVSRRIKSRFPETCIVFGGPQFPEEYEGRKQFFLRSPWVDFFLIHEGEKTFSHLAELFIQLNGNIQAVKEKKPGHSVFMMGDDLVSGPLVDRINITEVPSPFLLGLMDKFFVNLKPLVQFTRGCPFACTFCTEGMDSWNKVVRRDLDSVKEELEYIAGKIDRKSDLFIADSNFGMYPQDLDYCRIISDLQDRYSWPNYIHVATGKNNKERVIEASQIIHGALRLSASVQSTDPEVLHLIKRKNIDTKQIIEFGEAANRVEGNSYSELILALPGDSIKKHFKTIKDVIDSGLLTIRPFTLMLLESTELARTESKEEYKMLIKSRVLPRCFGRYPFFDEEDIVTAEIEEVCVGNSTLTFEDYLRCRRFHLTIEIFYNDGLFKELYKVLTHFGISAFSLLEKIHSESSKMDYLYKEFIRETSEELWDSSEDLIKFLREPGNIEKFKSGEYGANLLFKYKTLAMTKYMPEILNVAYDSALDMILSRQVDTSYTSREIGTFFEQLKKFNVHRSVQCFETEKVIEDNFNYNFASMESIDFPVLMKSVGNFKFEFRHLPEQKEVINYNKRLFGEDIIGLSRVLSQVYVRKCLRTVIYLRENGI